MDATVPRRPTEKTLRKNLLAAEKNLLAALEASDMTLHDTPPAPPPNTPDVLLPIIANLGTLLQSSTYYINQVIACQEEAGASYIALCETDFDAHFKALNQVHLEFVWDLSLLVDATWFWKRLNEEVLFVAKMMAYRKWVEGRFLDEMRREEFGSAVVGCPTLREFLAEAFGFFGEGFGGLACWGLGDWRRNGGASGIGGGAGGEGGLKERRKGKKAKK